MARKKSVPVSSSASTAKKKKTRKSSASTKAQAKTAVSKRTKSNSAATKTVDGILKAFDKERVAQNSALVATRKKIERLTKQISSIKEELESLKKTAVEAEIAIETLDARRDAEVGQLLSGMGIDLAVAAAAATPKAKVEKSTPLFDAAERAVDDDASTENADNR
jgi:chromosome segregation ATPase